MSELRFDQFTVTIDYLTLVLRIPVLIGVDELKLPGGSGVLVGRIGVAVGNGVGLGRGVLVIENSGVSVAVGPLSVGVIVGKSVGEGV